MVLQVSKVWCQGFFKLIVNLHFSQQRDICRHLQASSPCTSQACGLRVSGIVTQILSRPKLLSFAFTPKACGLIRNPLFVPALRFLVLMVASFFISFKAVPNAQFHFRPVQLNILAAWKKTVSYTCDPQGQALHNVGDYNPALDLGPFHLSREKFHNLRS